MATMGQEMRTVRSALEASESKCRLYFRFGLFQAVVIIIISFAWLQASARSNTAIVITPDVAVVDCADCSLINERNISLVSANNTFRNNLTLARLEVSALQEGICTLQAENENLEALNEIFYTRSCDMAEVVYGLEVCRGKWDGRWVVLSREGL